MGGISFGPGVLADRLSELAGYKAGLALSIPQLCDHLSGSEYPDIILRSEKGGVRLRSEEYEAVFYKLLHQIGHTKEEFDGDRTGIYRFHKYRRTGQLDTYQGVQKIFLAEWQKAMAEAKRNGTKELDPEPFMREAARKYGKVGLSMAAEQLEVLDRAMNLSPHTALRAVDWDGEIALEALFNGTDDEPVHGRFIDQRYIDYLSVNTARLNDVHWRMFEKLTAEFFERDGYRVELGPGSGDDGVDVRVWRPDSTPSAHPLCIVQCKRQKAKVEKVIVKGLYADVEFERADYGVVVTTSQLAPGARKTISARGYPIKAVERDAVVSWVSALRTPGSGIVRS